jgi:hypothetical protein
LNLYQNHQGTPIVYIDLVVGHMETMQTPMYYYCEEHYGEEYVEGEQKP